MLWIFLQNQEWLLFSNRYLMKMNKKSTRTCFFYQGDDVAILNKVMQYVQNNETTKKLRLLTLRAKENNDLLIIDLKVLDRAYPRLILSSLNWRCFGPTIIDELSENGIFQKISCSLVHLEIDFLYRVAELGGVRLIM
jgi:hypothetical protein